MFEKAAEYPVIWDAIALMKRDCNELFWQASIHQLNICVYNEIKQAFLLELNYYNGITYLL